jgi:hypothetical protein
MIKRVSQRDVIGKLLKDNNMPDTPTARAIYRKMLEPDEDDDTQVYRKPWVGLTPEEVLDLFDVNNVYGSKWIEFTRTVEAALKKKNT